MTMVITPHLFEAFLKCPSKCYLRSIGEKVTENTYADWVRMQTEYYHSDGVRRLVEGLKENERVIAPPATESLKGAKWRLAVDFVARAQNLESVLHAVERMPSKEQGQPAQFIPIRFIFANKLSVQDKLLVAFDALILSELLGSDVLYGKVIHGDDNTTFRVKTSVLLSKVRKLTGKIGALVSAHSAPDLILNRHCAECEFMIRCKQKAVEADDLSLLSAMTESERARLRSKGIFTVNQFSYTFRPRRRPKRAKNTFRPHYPALQALSIRENTIHLDGDPQLPDSRSRVYLDIEGLPDNEFYYLIGALVISDGQETFQTFWADQKSDEPVIFSQFIEAVCPLADYRVFHYGDYELVALKRMKTRLPECFRQKIDAILKQATNVLSVVHRHIYFPTYSNGLKDVGRFLEYKRAHDIATGLQTIIWRKSWEVTKDPDLKANLFQYNQDDCRTLNVVCKFIRRLIFPDATSLAVHQTLPKTMRTDEMSKERPRWQLFGPKEYASEDLGHINKCAYFDYQREKVFVRTHRQFRIINKQHRMLKRTKIRPNKIINIESIRCPRCQKKSIEQIKQLGRLLIDLKFSRSSVKKWITKFRTYRYRCRKCGHVFRSETRSRGGPSRYGHDLMSWCLYSWIYCGMNMNRIRMALGDMFEIFLNDDRIGKFRHTMAVMYEGLYDAILQCMLQEKVLHVDETSVNLRSLKGYVWVIAGMDKVYYLYKPSREGSFLQEILHPFSGVLISDFYSAYDSLSCEQQKCLIHIVRDIDNDLLKNPLDKELKVITQQFGSLLRIIIQTVDRYGLKSRYLRKHKPAVLRFLNSVVSMDFSSELADNYKKRFQKSGLKMFTFLDHDGVPWNNNNAEHAIKRFAKFRVYADGRFTERSLKDYLILASIIETCEFNNINVLKFLLSKETTLEGLFKMAGRMTKVPGIARVRAGGEEGRQSLDGITFSGASATATQQTELENRQRNS